MEKCRNRIIVQGDDSVTQPHSLVRTVRQECVAWSGCHAMFPHKVTSGGQVKVGGQDLAFLENCIQALPAHLGAKKWGLGLG